MTKEQANDWLKGMQKAINSEELLTARAMISGIWAQKIVVHLIEDNIRMQEEIEQLKQKL